MHVLGAVFWVGGIAFMSTVPWPSLTVLEPAPCVALHQLVLRRFFRIVLHAMPLVLLSG